MIALLDFNFVLSHTVCMFSIKLEHTKITSLMKSIQIAWWWWQQRNSSLNKYEFRIGIKWSVNIRMNKYYLLLLVSQTFWLDWWMDGWIDDWVRHVCHLIHMNVMLLLCIFRERSEAGKSGLIFDKSERCDYKVKIRVISGRNSSKIYQKLIIE